jgi:hypothetical protein
MANWAESNKAYQNKKGVGSPTPFLCIGQSFSRSLEDPASTHVLSVRDNDKTGF